MAICGFAIITVGYLASTPDTERMEFLLPYQELADQPISQTACDNSRKEGEGIGFWAGQVGAKNPFHIYHISFLRLTRKM